jgi:hypothetical protein
VSPSQRGFDTYDATAEPSKTGPGVIVTVSRMGMELLGEKEPGAKLMIESKLYICAEPHSRDGAWMSSSSHTSSAGLRAVLYVDPREVYLAKRLKAYIGKKNGQTPRRTKSNTVF